MIDNYLVFHQTAGVAFHKLCQTKTTKNKNKTAWYWCMHNHSLPMLEKNNCCTTSVRRGITKYIHRSVFLAHLEWATMSTGNHTHRGPWGLTRACGQAFTRYQGGGHIAFHHTFLLQHSEHHMVSVNLYALQHVTIYQVWFCTLAPRSAHKPSSWPNLVFGISSWPPSPLGCGGQPTPNTAF